MRILITGFDAFDKADVNPSQQAVGRLDERLLRAVGLDPETIGETYVLKTCCNEAWERVEDEVDGIPPNEDFAIILTGFAGNRNRICLERFALNCRAYRIADNEGHQYQEEYLDPKAPDALRCKLPLFELMDTLNEKGLASDISNYAGTFVCNETYFRAMQKWNENPRCKGVLFVHVPAGVDYFGTNPDQKPPESIEEIEQLTEKAINEYARAFAEIAKFVEENAANQQIAVEKSSVFRARQHKATKR